MKKIVCAAVAGLMMVGCATQRPQMPDERYAGFARAWNTVGRCVSSGWMDADTAARGRTYISSAMNTYTYSQEDMRDTINGEANRMPSISPEQCRMAAMDIQMRKQQIANQNAQTDMQQREVQNMINATKPTQTYCNKIGTQVLCNSF